MTAVWMIVRSRWRRGVVAQIVIAITIMLVGSAVLATVAGARRTSSSFDRLVTANAPPDLALELSGLDTQPTDAQVAELTALPQVAGSARLVAFAMSPAGKNVYQPIAGMVDDGWGTEVDRPLYVRGRAPVAEDEVSMDEKRATNLGLELGDTVTMVTYTPAQLLEFGSGAAPEPAGPVVDLRLVGIERTPASLSSDVDLATITRLPQAFTHRYRGTIGEWSEIIFVDLSDGDVDAFASAMHQVPGFETARVDGAGTDKGGTVAVTMGFVARALAVLAAIMALAGLVAIYVLMVRMLGASAAEDTSLTAMGLDRRLRVGAALLEASPGIVVGVAGAAAGAALASTLFPFGIAGRAEPHPGFAVDVLALSFGLAALAVASILMAGLAARQVRRRTALGADPRPSMIADALQRAGAPWTLVTGGRLMLGRTRRSAVRTAVFGVCIGTAGLTAALIFAASQTSLESTPRRWGVGWDAELGGDTVDDLGRFGVTAMNTVHVSQLQVDGQLVEFRSFDAGADAPMVVVSDGHVPGPGEIILGARTMAQLDVSIGDSVTVSGELGETDLEVVGTGVFNGIVDVPVLGAGAAVLSTSLAEVSDLTADDGFDTMLVRLASDADREALIDSFADHEGLTRDEAERDITPSVPDELDRLAEVKPLPWVLAVFLGLLAVLATTSLLTSTVRRQRHDFAILRSQGLDRRGLRHIVTGQSLAVSVSGLLFGIPAGVIIGRLVWSAVARDMGVIASTTIPWLAVAAMVIAVLVVDLGAGLVPARSATRARPAAILRTE